ncbi:MAG: 3-hydroxyacyl-CoA dehydrogenase family protein [Deltaproteobacteria bacterium]|nr:3-hydroxyacyl-CoA dehydrogenase family protein [Deltaproteobacteria bacterium]
MPSTEIQRAAVVGSGLMGSSIAQVLAAGGVEVDLVDVDEKALARGRRLIESGLATLAEAGKVPPERIGEILGRIHPARDLRPAAEAADFAIEAVPEVPRIKERILTDLGEVCRPGAVIASNTSALNVFELGDVPHPERLVIAHFFAPAHIVPLVEVVPGPETSADTVSRTAAFLRGLGKSPIVMKKFGPGFIVNRIQKAIGEACLELVEEGLVEPPEVDRAVKLSLGVRLPVVGVMQTLDFQGLDMLLDTMKNYGRVFRFIEEKVREGRLGAKTSCGIYEYQGRSEEEILRKRDLLYLKMLDVLTALNTIEPV